MGALPKCDGLTITACVTRFAPTLIRSYVKSIQIVSLLLSDRSEWCCVRGRPRGQSPLNGRVGCSRPRVAVVVYPLCLLLPTTRLYSVGIGYCK